MNINTKYIKDLDLGSASTNTSVTYMVIQEAIGTNPTQKIALDTLFLESTARAKSAVRLVDNNFAVGQRVSGDVELIGTQYDFKRNGVGLFAQYATLLNSLGEYANKNDANTFADSQMFLSAITCDGGISVPNPIDILFNMDQVSLETLLQERAVVTDNNTFGGTQSFNNINSTGTFAGNTINASTFGIIGYVNPGVTADLATVLSGKANSSYPVFEDGVRIEFQADPQDPNGDTIFEIVNTVDSSVPFSINDWGNLRQTKNAYFSGDVFEANNPKFTGDSMTIGESAELAYGPNYMYINVNGEGLISSHIDPNDHSSDVMEFGDRTYATSNYKGKNINIQTGIGIGESLNGTGDVNIYAKNLKFNGVDIPTSELSGSNYVMVYGVGTPTENAAELQAAYDEAKSMPRYLGEMGEFEPIHTYYVGQTAYAPFGSTAGYFKCIQQITFTEVGQQIDKDGQSEYFIEITEPEAKSVRTTVIVAPGEYDFGSSTFTIDATGVDVVSLTGNADVIIRRLIVSADYIYIKGITALSGFGVRSTLANIVIEDCESKTSLASYSYLQGSGILLGTFINCKGTDWSFAGNDGGPGKASGTFINCAGGNYSFGGGGGGTADGTFINCVGGDNSFAGLGGGTALGKFINCTGGETSFGLGSGSVLTGTLENCKLTSGTFQTPTVDGKIYNCIDGSGALINNPLPVFSDNVAAALLATGAMYRTATGVQMIKY